jgi:hypothetical protein
MGMKKERRIHFKMDEAEFTRFDAACRSINEPYSAVLRHLCKAASDYIAANQLTQWYPPKLVPDQPKQFNNPGNMGNVTARVAPAPERIEPIHRHAEPHLPKRHK